LAGYVRQSAADIVPTAVVRAAPINNELNALRDAFVHATGHKHDGTAAEGHFVPVVADFDGKNKIAVDTTNNRHGVFVEVGGTSTEQLRFQDGAIVPVTDNDIDLGTASLEFKDLYIDGTANIDSLVADTADINAGTIDNTVIGASTAVAATVTALTATGNAAIGGTLAVTGNTSLNGNVAVGDATSDTVSVAARITTGLIPNNDNAFDLGSAALEWKDLFIDGTANVDSLQVDENAIVTGNTNIGGTLAVTGQATLANINATGGVINNTVIGGSTPVAITGTTVTANTGFVGNVTGNVTGNLTGNVTASSGGSTFNNVTVNGTIDVTNTVIANVASPVLNTDAATKGYVDTTVNALIDAAPGTLDTLNELAAALGDDPNFATTVTTQLAGKLSLTGGTMTGAIAMSSNKITGLGTPTTGTDAVTKAYTDTLFGDTADAADSAAAAAASAAAAEDSYDSFDDRYLGAKSSSPTLDNDGNALLTGALYFDTTSEKMKVYTGTSWVDAGSAVNGTAERYVYTATASQTTFVATYDVGFVDVYLNGVKQVAGTDFTASSGTNIVLAVGATAGDIVDIVAYGAFNVANTYTQAAADAKFAQVANNLSDLANASTARVNLGVAIGSDVQAYDATIVVDADIGVNVQAYDATLLNDADIGSTVQAYDATLLNDADIGSTVQAYDATLLNDADIGSTVQAYDADTTTETNTQTFTNKTITNLVNDGSITEEVYALTGTELEPDNGTIQTKTLAANTTFTESVAAGQSLVLMLNAGASYTVTWPTMTWVTSGGNVAPTLTANDTLVFWKVGSTLYGAYVGSYV